MKDKVKIVAGIILMLACLVYGFALMFANPDMTQVRLLLTYWKQYVIMILVMFYSYYLVASGLNEL
jgi:hypothetical protein